MNDIILFCRLPSRNDPEKLYKYFRRFNISDISIANLPDSDDGKNRFQLIVSLPKTNNTEVYILKFRKKDLKSIWWDAFIDLEVPSVEPSDIKPVIISKPKKLNSDLVDEAVQALLYKLQKELEEETEARILAEQHNEVMKNLVYDQKKAASQNLMDDSSMSEFESRLENLSSLVDQLRSENIALTNQVKSKRNELITLRKAYGRNIDDLIGEANDEEDDEDDSE